MKPAPAAGLNPHRPEFLWSPTRTELITTKFMRNRLLFSTLANELLPKLRQAKGRPLRLLFWACSTGAEPHTLKFLLGADAADEIVGIDFDAAAIQQAQAATYHPDTWKMFFGVEKNLLTESEVKELFEPSAAGSLNSFRVTERYRKNVTFLTGDLFSATATVPEKSFDLVVCNNLLLHLKPHSADAAFDFLLRYLDDDGLLLVSGCHPAVRCAAAKRLGLQPLPDKLAEISRNWAGVSGAWNFPQRPAWAWPEPLASDPDFNFQAGEIFQRSGTGILPVSSSCVLKNAPGTDEMATALPHPQSLSRWEREAVNESRGGSEVSPADAAITFSKGGERFPLSQRERAGVRENGLNLLLGANDPDGVSSSVKTHELTGKMPVPLPKNIIITGSTFWNPGDDFVREGVIRVLRETLGDTPLNFLFYNFNPDTLPHAAELPHSNLISHGDLEKFRDHVDAIVVVGVSAGHELKPLYRWVLANNLADKVLLISGHYQSDYAAEHIAQEPEASIFKQARLIIGRTNKFPAFIRENNISYHRVNCPALLSVPEVKTIPAGKKIQRIGFSIQLPRSLGGLVNQDCGEEPYRLALEKLHALAKNYSVELVTHHKTEYFHFLNALRGTGIRVIFSSFYHDLFATYRRYDLVVTTRLHTSLFANGHGIPGIVINDTDRHTHALEGFQHSPWVTTPDAFEKVFARWQQADLSAVAKELDEFKSKLIARYVELLKPVMNPPSAKKPATTMTNHLTEKLLAALHAPANRERVLKIVGGLEKDYWIETHDLVRYREAGDWFDTATFLNWYGEHLKPVRYFEIGVRRGRSMAQVLIQSPPTEAFGFDMWIPNYASLPERGVIVPNPGPEFVQSELRNVGVTRPPTLTKGDSHATVPKFFADPANPQWFDLMLVDGDHTADGARADLEIAFQHLAPGGALVFDDIYHPAHLDLLDVWNEFVRRFPDHLFIMDKSVQGTAVAFRPPFNRLMAALGVEPPAAAATPVEPAKNSAPATNLDGARKILFVRTDSIGDAVLASSMIEPLKQRYPSAQLAVLCQAHVADLFAACPFVTSVICYDRKQVESSAAERAQILAEIAAFKPDVVLNSVRSRDKFSDDLTLALPDAHHIAIESDLNNVTPADHAAARSRYEFVIPTTDGHRIELERHADFLRGVGVEILNDSMGDMKSASVPPHPQSLSRREREAASDTRSSSEISPTDAAVINPVGVERLPLSQRERAGVRENGSQTITTVNNFHAAADGLQPVVWITPDEELIADEFFKMQALDPQQTIAVFPGAQHEVRVYRRYADALKNLSGYRFLIFGDASQSALAEDLERQLPGRTVNLCGRSLLRETVALMKRCRLYVGAESAGAHIACAVGVPNVVLLGGGHFARFMPYSPLTSAVTLPLDCFGCNWRCSHARAHCIKDVAPELIAEAIRQTLGKKSARPRIFLQSSQSWSGGMALPAWKKPDALLTGQNVEFIEVTCAPAIFSNGVSLPTPPKNQERVACPACGENNARRVRQSADIVQCRACDTVYLRTRLTRDAMRALYQTYADEGSHMALPKTLAEAEQSGLKRDYFLKEILSFIKPGGNFLDVGCGWGAFLLNARSQGFTPRGIELTKACVGYANSQLQISVTDTQLDEAAIAPASLRVVTMNHVFEHLPEPRAALKKIFEALEPGGMFCGIVPNFASVCSETLKEEWFWLDPNYHYQHFTPATLRKIFESAGFVVEKIYTATGDYGRDSVRQACEKLEAKFADEIFFAAELARYESDGRGEEIRFFIRKPATPVAPELVAAPPEECPLIPPIASGPEPLVSVVVSTYQSEKFIRACLENLSRQTIFDRCEIIVVDSGSPENERAIVAEFQQKFPNIRYVRTPRETLYAAWNRGLELARGRYFANVNTDDSLRHDALEILVASLEKHSDCAYSYADCAWTTKANDTFPSAHTIKTVRYPGYAPMESLFYCLTGCLQFFRAETLRRLGGFDASLKCAGDYEATLKVMAARLNAVHVPEVLSLFFQNTGGLTQASNRAALEHDAVMDRYRSQLDLANIFQVDAADKKQKADALALLGQRATKFSVPWETDLKSHHDFAFACFEAALNLDPENIFAGMNLVALHLKLNRLNQHETELVQRWPKMREWIADARSGQCAAPPPLKHAVPGPVYRPFEHAQRPTAKQLAREPKALQPWIARIAGRHVYLSEELFPRAAGLNFTPQELQAAGSRFALLLKELPPFYAHFGGAGDALLLLAAFYDQHPQGVVFSHPNGIGAAQALFDAFPKLSKIYFLPQHSEPFFHIVLRYAVYELKNCLGAGTTPRFGYEEEWKAGLDLTKKYGVKLAPRWAKDFRSGTGILPVSSSAQKNFRPPAANLPRPSEGRGNEGEGSEGSLGARLANEVAVNSEPLTPALSPRRGEGEKNSGTGILPVSLSCDVKNVAEAHEVTSVLPHPQSLSRWEREAANESRGSSEISPADAASTSSKRGERFSLSQRERAGVRENSPNLSHAAHGSHEIEHTGKMPVPRLRRVAVAPKGSLSGMVGSKRNIILPEQWRQVVAHIIERGFEPVILGTPGEAKEYPALTGCVDGRKESFPGQMNLIGECAGLVGADSWAKTFSALAEIPTLVFEPIKGADLISWKDPSDWVFIEPWPSIKMVRSLEDFCKAFDARIAKLPDAQPQKNAKPVIAWEGSFLDYGSLSHINRELTARLPQVACVGSTALPERAKNDADMKRCAKKLSVVAPKNAAVTVRHQWPPDWSRPASGSLVVIQPWEYGALPKAWVEQSANVDEFWVPSPLVRAMYLDSGIAPEKVRVIPNGVDSKKFRPGVTPLKLATKKKFKFLFVGGTIFRKGSDVLLEAFSQVFSANDDVCLVIKDFGGDSFYQGQTAENAVRALQKIPSAPEIIYLKEELSSAQMPSLYAACDCLVLPYRGEGFGMPVLEAMSCGLPVIVTAGGATDSFVANEAGWKIPSHGVHIGNRLGEIELVKNGWLREPSKPQFGALMKYAAAHPDDCRQRGAAGRGIVERRFDWNDIAAAVAHRLKELAEKFGAPSTSSASSNLSHQRAERVLGAPAVARIGRLDEARELFAQKNFDGAWNAAVAASAQRPFHPAAFLLLAETALAAGDSASAKQCAEHARALAPGFEPAKKFLKQKFSGGTKQCWADASLVTRHSSRISVCLITKNEEKFLAACLKSVHGLAAQIVVVDTGSTDRTVEIAKAFGAEVFAFAWCDDFAAARNAALEHAIGDWVLVLDADEELTAAQHAKLLTDITNAEVLGFRLPLVNAGQENEGRSFIPRLFRNAPGVFFHGRIHEQVFPSLLPLGKTWGMSTALGTAEILHHGYTKELVRDRNKVERNLKLLRAALAENPADANLLMNLGLELVRSDDLRGGIEKYREAFALMSAQTTEIVPELREALLTQFTSQLYKVRGHEEVVRVLNSPLAKNHGGLNASLHLALGLSLFELKKYSEAAQQMRECIAKRSLLALTPINVDIRTAAPWHCLALCQLRTGEAADAEKSFTEAVAANGRANEARVDFAKFLAEQNRAVDALKELHAAITADATFALAWRLGGQLALAQPELLEFALDWTGAALEKLPEDVVVKSNRAEAWLLTGNISEAAPLWAGVWEKDRLPRSLAALCVCQLAFGKKLPAPGSLAEEEQCSRAFIGWYQRLLGVSAAETVRRLNENFSGLAVALPTAEKILRAALSEAQAEPAVL